MSVQWWKRNHNTHHVVCNSVNYDPDVQYLPLFAVTEKMFNGFYSWYYQTEFKFDNVARALIPYQKYLLIPVMGVARWNLYAQSFLLMFNFKTKVNRRWEELGALVFYWIWLGGMLYSIETGLEVFAFLFISHFVAGIVHLQIVISHFAMP